jgi:sugar phosphate isomerase/epimerase
MPGPTAGPFVLSGFADETAEGVDDQLAALEELGIERIDLRMVDGTNVVDAEEATLDAVEAALDRHDVEVAAIGSPIGKVEVTDPFEPHLERFERTLAVAERFDTDAIRMFSYWIPDGEDPADHRTEVLERTRRKVELAEEAGVTLYHENEKDLYGDTPGRVRDLLRTVDSPNFRAIFDPANFLEIGVEAYPDALLQVIEYVDWLHVKDAALGQRGAIRMPGEGDANFQAIVETLDRRGFEGVATMEPHLQAAGEKGGFSGPEKFGAATRAFREIVAEVRSDT